MLNQISPLSLQQGPQSGAIDPRYGPAGPPPDVQDSQSQNGQGQYNSQDQGASNPESQNAPPAYRQPYNGAPPARYGQQSAPPQYGAQVGGQAVTVPGGALLRVRLVEGLTAKRIKAGTVFDATVLNDVIADGEVAIPRGASVQGTIVESNPSGAVGGKGQLALQLNSVSLSGRNYPIVSDTWTHYGRDKTGQTVGSAVGLGAFGALIGAVAGGGAGAAIGAAAGGAAGIGASAASGRNDVVIPPEAIISFHLVQPAGVTTVPQQEMDRLGYGVQQANMQRRQPAPPPGVLRPSCLLPLFLLGVAPVSLERIEEKRPVTCIGTGRLFRASLIYTLALPCSRRRRCVPSALMSRKIPGTRSAREQNARSEGP